MDIKLNILSLLGVFGICFFAWICSSDRGKIPYGTIKWALGTQFIIVFLCLIFPGVLQLFQKIFHIFASVYLLFVSGTDDISDFTVSLLGNSIFRGITISLFFSIIFFYITKTNLFVKILTGVGKISRNTFRLHPDEFIISIMSTFLSYEAIFLSPRFQSFSESRLFSILALLVVTPSSLLILREYSLIKSVSQSFLGHLYLASFLSVFSTVVISKILVPGDIEERESENPKKTDHNIYVSSELGIKFIVGLFLGGIVFQIFITFLENLLGSFVFAGDLRIVPEDGWVLIITKVFKSGLTETFTRLTLKNILAFFLLPLCFLSGISSEILEIWKIAVLFSNSYFGQAYEAGIPAILKEGTFSLRASFFSVYFLVGGTSLIKVGMVWGAVLAILPEKMAMMISFFSRLLLVSLLAPFLSISVLGIFELGQLHF